MRPVAQATITKLKNHNWKTGRPNNLQGYVCYIAQNVCFPDPPPPPPKKKKEKKSTTSALLKWWPLCTQYKTDLWTAEVAKCSVSWQNNNNNNNNNNTSDRTNWIRKLAESWTRFWSCCCCCQLISSLSVVDSFYTALFSAFEQIHCALIVCELNYEWL